MRTISVARVLTTGRVMATAKPCVTTAGDPRCTRPLAGSAVAIRARPPAISNPAIRFRLIPPIIVGGIRKPVKTPNRASGVNPGALFVERSG